MWSLPLHGETSPTPNLSVRPQLGPHPAGAICADTCAIAAMIMSSGSIEIRAARNTYASRSAAAPAYCAAHGAAAVAGIWPSSAQFGPSTTAERRIATRHVDRIGRTRAPAILACVHSGSADAYNGRLTAARMCCIVRACASRSPPPHARSQCPTALTDDY